MCKIQTCTGKNRYGQTGTEVQKMMTVEFIEITSTVSTTVKVAELRVIWMFRLLSYTPSRVLRVKP